ncbi:polysaccharide pyruvyl transferase family protein [Salinimicrobium sp. GXAS 041]|uniref:polysaccharide pyruvyl transferase family protein n=1 Tax=Salinimicrobium sp. GXAS 041 TaxID=3400806 RepID=UPI003C7237F5
MSMFKFLKRIATSPSRSVNKATVLKKAATKKQCNYDVVNIHRIDSKNVGDFYCAPHLYFKSLHDKKLDIFDYKIPDKKVTENWINTISHNALIIGGGGILNRGSFQKQMKLFESLSYKNKKMVIWGAGHNSKDRKDFGKILNYTIDINRFGLVGTRDYKASNTWVPCVSCLNPVFNEVYNSSQEIGVIFHKKTMKNKSITSKFKDFPTTSNTTNLESLIEFIGNSETIITDSYHAMYWAILLEKKVVVIPNSSKFFDFKYQPIFSRFETCIEDVKKARTYSGVLEECKEINLKFAQKAFEYLEIESPIE